MFCQGDHSNKNTSSNLDISHVAHVQNARCWRAPCTREIQNHVLSSQMICIPQTLHCWSRSTCRATKRLSIEFGSRYASRFSFSKSIRMLHINVALPSGRSENLSVLQSSKVGDLRVLAQKSFEQGFLKLVTSEGHVLNDPTESLQTAGLQDGDHITAISLQARLAATASAFALWCCGCDKIVTWGSAYHGGDSSRVQEKLKGVQQVQTTWNAFAAILSDGSVCYVGRSTVWW